MSLPANIHDLASAMEQASEKLNHSTGQHQFLKMDKAGAWVYGADETEASGDSVWVINPNFFAQGFVAWGENKEGLLGEEMALLTEPPIVKADLEDVGAPWKEQVGLMLVCIEGEDKGVTAIFKTSSFGGRKEFKRILDAVLAQIRADSEDIVPIVFLENDHYKHKTYGKIFTPVFEVDGWCDLSGVPEPEAVEAEAEAEEEEEAPKKKKPKKKAPAKKKPEPEDDDVIDAEFEEIEEDDDDVEPEADEKPAPTRRRRRTRK